MVLDSEGRSDFGALRRSLGGRGGKRVSTVSVLFAFDLLYFDGGDLTRTELSVRRHLLEGAVGAIQLSEEVPGDGAELLENARSLGLEGIIAKHRDRPYRSGRTGDWLKNKCIQSERFMIVGYEQSAVGTRRYRQPAAGRQAQARLGLCRRRRNGLQGKDAAYLKKTLDTLKRWNPVVPLKGKNYVFAQPTLIAEIEFRGSTDDSNLRHASYEGQREIQDHAAVYKLD